MWAGAEPAGQRRDEKLCAVVARSTCRTKNAQKTSASEDGYGFVEFAKSKKWTPLWHETHFEVKMYKTNQGRTTVGSWDVEKVRAVVARNAFRSQTVNTTCLDNFWAFSCRFAWQAPGSVHVVDTWATREGFVAFPKTMASVGHLKRMW